VVWAEPRPRPLWLDVLLLLCGLVLLGSLAVLLGLLAP
jgi:hypothetical protein